MLCGCCADVVWMLCGCVELCPMSNTTRDGAIKRHHAFASSHGRASHESRFDLSKRRKKQENPRWPQWEPMRIISLKGFLYRANVCIKYYKRISPYICLILPSFSLLLEVWKRNFCLAAPPGAPVRLQTAPCSLQQHKHPDPKAHTKHLTTRLLKIIEDSTSDF